MNRQLINRMTILGLVLVISGLFLTMIHQFLMAIFMAGLFSAMVSPIHRRLTTLLRGRENLASVLTVLGIVLLVLIPLAILITIVVAQAISVGQAVTPWVQSFIHEPSTLSAYLAKIPYYDQILPYRDIIIQKAGQLVGTISTFLIDSLSSFTKLTIDIIFSSIIMLYVMFYFLTMGVVLLKKILFFFPLDDQNEEQLLERFTSVTRATIKGTLIIGLLQGTICGIAFALAGINAPVFWGSLMAITSIIPAFGTAIIDRKSTRLNSSHNSESRMPSSA
jgi:predicted PurR-regulated permease PerM